MSLYKAPGGGFHRSHFTREVQLGANDANPEIGANGEREIIIGTAGFAAIYAEVICGEALDVTVSDGHSEEGPWGELETGTSSGDPETPNRYEVACKRPYVRFLFENGATPTTDFSFACWRTSAVI